MTRWWRHKITREPFLRIPVLRYFEGEHSLQTLNTMYVCARECVRSYSEPQNYWLEKQKTALIFNFHQQTQEVRMNNGRIHLFKGKTAPLPPRLRKINNFSTYVSRERERERDGTQCIPTLIYIPKSLNPDNTISILFT